MFIFYFQVFSADPIMFIINLYLRILICLSFIFKFYLQIQICSLSTCICRSIYAYNKLFFFCGSRYLYLYDYHVLSADPDMFIISYIRGFRYDYYPLRSSLDHPAMFFFYLLGSPDPDMFIISLDLRIQSRL